MLIKLENEFEIFDFTGEDRLKGQYVISSIVHWHVKHEPVYEWLLTFPYILNWAQLSLHALTDVSVDSEWIHAYKKPVSGCSQIMQLLLHQPYLSIPYTTNVTALGQLQVCRNKWQQSPSRQKGKNWKKVPRQSESAGLVHRVKDKASIE